jgi:hypothetical protein
MITNPPFPELPQRARDKLPPAEASPTRVRKFQLGFSVTKAEESKYTLEEYDITVDELKTWVCNSAEELHDQMRAWVERQIAGHKIFLTRQANIDFGVTLAAARDMPIGDAQ